MGASSTGLKSHRGDSGEDQPNQLQIIVPRLSIQDVENNNNHIFVNPHPSELNFLPIHALIDECDLLNNNTTLINNNYLTVSLTSPSSNALSTSLKKLNTRQALYRLCEQETQLNKSVAKMQNESSKKSPKRKVDEKVAKEKDKKKKVEKPKPKPPRPTTGGGGGGGKGRGMADKDKMMKRPRKKTKAEK